MKKRTKRLLTVMTAATMTFGSIALVPASAAAVKSESVAVQSGTTGDCTWTLDDDGTLTVSGNGEMGGYGYYQWDNAKKVIINEGVTAIGENEFFACYDLESVSIPSSVKTINKLAFALDEKLTDVTISEGVTFIGNGAFYECKSLTSISLPKSVKTIELGAFSRSGLKSLIIPECVKSLECVGDCENLTDVLVPASVTDFSKDVFYNNRNGLIIYTPNGSYAQSRAEDLGIEVLEPEDYPQDFSWTLDEDGTLTVSGKGNMQFGENGKAPWGTDIKKVIVKDGITAIRSNAFTNCRNLTEVTIPNSVKAIGSGAFSGCSALTSVNLPNGLNAIKSSAFQGCSRLREVTVPDSVKAIESGAFSDCSALTSVNLPDGLKAIKSSTFLNCLRLSDVAIPGSVKTIEYCAFDGCKGLKTLTFSDGVTEIGDYAFRGSESLTRVIIPSTVTSIGTEAFFNSLCPPTVYGEKGSYVQTYADENDLYFEPIENYPALSWSVDDNGVLTISGNTQNYFSGPQARTAPWGKDVTAVVIKDGVKSIGNYAFYNCQKLKSITIPDSVTCIGDWAFGGCISLTTITLPDSITEIGYGAFYNSGLKHLTIPDGVTEIFNFTFDRCPDLETVILPETVTRIGEMFNYDYESHTKLLIPESVVSIADEGSFTNKRQSILGYEDSYAQRFATEHDIPFEAVTKGDLNFDGTTTIEDATQMQKSLAEFSGVPSAENSAVIKLADVNGDGKFSIRDVTEMQRHLAEL